jgi:DNA replication initiation complex subunit (GINS family)
MSEINITYETLFELLRREKNRDDIQKLDQNFLDEAADYIKEKTDVAKQQKEKNDLFAAEETRKAELQIANIKKIMRELYNRRERKIIYMAIDASRSSTSLVDTSNLLNKERIIFDEMVNLLNKYRQGILFHILEGMQPNIVQQAERKEEQPEEAKEIKAEEEPYPNPSPKQVIEETRENKKTTKMIRFRHAVPKFVGKDLEIYGPFEENDMANLPAEIADVLISKERAEEMED